MPVPYHEPFRLTRVPYSGDLYRHSDVPYSAVTNVVSAVTAEAEPVAPDVISITATETSNQHNQIEITFSNFTSSSSTDTYTLETFLVNLQGSSQGRISLQPSVVSGELSPTTVAFTGLSPSTGYNVYIYWINQTTGTVGMNSTSLLLVTTPAAPVETVYLYYDVMNITSTSFDMTFYSFQSTYNTEDLYSIVITKSDNSHAYIADSVSHNNLSATTINFFNLPYNSTYEPRVTITNLATNHTFSLTGGSDHFSVPGVSHILSNDTSESNTSHIISVLGVNVYEFKVKSYANPAITGMDMHEFRIYDNDQNNEVTNYDADVDYQPHSDIAVYPNTVPGSPQADLSIRDINKYSGGYTFSGVPLGATFITLVLLESEYPPIFYYGVNVGPMRTFVLWYDSDKSYYTYDIWYNGTKMAFSTGTSTGLQKMILTGINQNQDPTPSPPPAYSASLVVTEASKTATSISVTIGDFTVSDNSYLDDTYEFFLEYSPDDITYTTSQQFGPKDYIISPNTITLPVSSTDLTSDTRYFIRGKILNHTQSSTLTTTPIEVTTDSAPIPAYTASFSITYVSKTDTSINVSLSDFTVSDPSYADDTYHLYVQYATDPGFPADPPPLYVSLGSGGQGPVYTDPISGTNNVDLPIPGDPEEVLTASTLYYLRSKIVNSAQETLYGTPIEVTTDAAPAAPDPMISPQILTEDNGQVTADSSYPGRLPWHMFDGTKIRSDADANNLQTGWLANTQFGNVIYDFLAAKTITKLILYNYDQTGANPAINTDIVRVYVSDNSIVDISDASTTQIVNLTGQATVNVITINIPSGTQVAGRYMRLYIENNQSGSAYVGLIETEIFGTTPAVPVRISPDPYLTDVTGPSWQTTHILSYGSATTNRPPWNLFEDPAQNFEYGFGWETTGSTSAFNSNYLVYDFQSSKTVTSMDFTNFNSSGGRNTDIIKVWLSNTLSSVNGSTNPTTLTAGLDVSGKDSLQTFTETLTANNTGRYMRLYIETANPQYNSVALSNLEIYGTTPAAPSPPTPVTSLPFTSGFYLTSGTFSGVTYVQTSGTLYVYGMGSSQDAARFIAYDYSTGIWQDDGSDLPTAVTQTGNQITLSSSGYPDLGTFTNPY